MKNKIKKTLTYTLIMSPQIALAQNISCGNKEISYELIKKISSFISIITISISTIIILIGIINFIKSKKNIKKRISKLIKKIITAIIIILLLPIINLILIKKDIAPCAQCVINSKKCNIIEEKEESINQLQPEITNPTAYEPIEPEKKEEEFKIIEEDGVTYIDGILIVNKTYSLPKSYMPKNASGKERCNECLTEETLTAFKKMQADAQSIGLNLYISSGYRSYTYQEGLYNRYAKQDGKDKADTYSARPGHSEHQTGLAFDLNTIDDSFANTPEGKWVVNNCQKYGLILRYPKGKEEQTGYQYESWHLRYVGEELANKLYDDGNWMTLEEYFNIESKYE